MDRPVNRWVLYAAILAVVFAVAVGVNSVVYANYVARRSERQWCQIIIELDDAYRKTPPTTPLGRELAADFHNLRQGFGC